MALPEILNTNQILQGARTVGGSKTYSSVIVDTALTSVAAGDVAIATNDNAVGSVLTLTGGKLEVEGVKYAVGSGATAPATLNLYNVKNLLLAGKTYRLEAVPTYSAPIDQPTAEAAGKTYFVQDGANSILHPFIKQSVIDAVANFGGLVALEQLVYGGTATLAQKAAYTTYKEAEDTYLDLRYNAAAPLPVTGYEFVLSLVENTVAAGGQNVLTRLSQAEVLDVRATVEFIYSTRTLYAGTAAAVTAYGATPWLVDENKSFGYANSTDQANDANRIPITAKAGTFVKVSDGSTVPFIALAIINFPGYLPRGQAATGIVPIRYLTKKESLFLGRIDPIYLANQNDGPKFARAKLSRLTNWADPQAILSFTATPAVTTGAAATSTPFISATNLVNLT
jgi:hypothetical protein